MANKPVVGDESGFAVCFDVLERVDGWVFGSFNFFIKGVVVGNPLDRSVDLKGCVRWMEDFVNIPENRFEPGLFEMNKENVFSELTRGVLAAADDGVDLHPVYKNIFSRFHLSHIGMSSFDDVVLLLLKDAHGNERLVWKSSDSDIQDAFLEEEAIERVFARAIDELKGQMRNSPSCQ